jgi:uroporphyrinogen decarboxylase
MDRHTRLHRALTGQPVDRTPIWFMRQAGRYLPEYRAVRERASFLDLCGNPDLALEVTLQPVDRFGLDAAIAFSDILIVLQAVGFPVTFEEKRGPVLPSPFRDVADLQRLRDANGSPYLQTLPATIRAFRQARPDTPILGFAGAPWTLLCYLVEGQGSREWTRAKALLWEQPAVAQQLLDHLADAVGDLLQAQVDAGAAGVQIFDTWAGTLSPEDWRRWALPAMRRALSRVRGAPRIAYLKDSAPFLDALPETGAECIALDWRVDIAQARARLPGHSVQGNLDPAFLFAPPDAIRRRVSAILDAAGPVGHVFNLGHGIQPTTPIAGVEAMVETVLNRPIG